MKPFYVISLLRGGVVGLYAPLWILFLYHSGYNLFLLGLIGTIFEIAKFVFEVPSGAIADKFGVKVNLSISAICLSMTWLLFPFSSNWLILMTLLLTWTLSETLFSGTFEAWISSVVNEEQFSKVLLNNSKLYILCIIIIAPISGYLYHINKAIPFVLAGLISMILIIFIIRFIKIRSNPKAESESTPFSVLLIIKNATAVLFNNKRAFNIIIASFFFAFVIDTIDRYWQPYFQYIGIDESKFGFVAMTGGIVLLVMLHTFSQFNAKINQLPEAFNLLIVMLTIILIVLIALGKKLVTFISISFVTVMDDLMNVLINNALNQEMSQKSSSMATIFSLNGASGAFGEILSGVIFGYVILKVGYTVTFIACSALLIVPFICYLMNVRVISKEKHYTP
ncbi:MFS transporter [Staphylococcus felis]|uniref:MFS transporter n=1 Tax=Staphylococcus felis TaxID=46127 RepID=UPI000E27A491|nr:MFS transporter [Staphylococcus felis]REH77672.1 MFS transporter [Staphylococcus felis]REH95867.1 MFS transporter [Staphylococcus felis]REI04948.1 MFS transporter [Staphylococcus felis]